MPLLWRYLILSYLQVFFLTVISFVAILLTSRLEEIAHFASFGAGIKLISLFALFQIPYILPIAIPIASLIASILLMQRLSSDHELSAIRSAGISLKEIAAPLILTSVIIALASFYIVSELATLSHMKTNQLKSQLRSVNPLLLLHNKHLARSKGIYYDVLGPSKLGSTAQDVLLAIPNRRQGHLDLLLAKRITATEENVSAQQLTLFSTFNDSKPVEASTPGFENIFVETVDSSSSSVQDFALMAQKTVSTFSSDHLNLNLLLRRLADDRLSLKSTSVEDKSLRVSIRQGYSEIARRLSVALAPLSFTFLGLSFGINVGRLQKPWALAFPICLAALYLFCFFAAKAFSGHIAFAFLLYLSPHFLLAAVSFWKIDQVTQGAA